MKGSREVLEMEENGELEEQENHPTPDEMPTTGLIDDCEAIINLGEQMKTDKINYSFKSIFGGHS
jgi:hypothetical protein|tara:strand:- start:2449 stop:2643 length:195 start_codon:yes stop_codon:yes gene_type:complete